MNAADRIEAWERALVARRRVGVIVLIAVAVVLVAAIAGDGFRQSRGLERDIQARDRATVQALVAVHRGLRPRDQRAEQLASALAAVTALRPHVASAIRRADSAAATVHIVPLPADSSQRTAAEATDDTTQMVGVMRTGSPRIYPVPLFFVDAYRVEHATRDTITTIAGVLDVALTAAAAEIAADSVVIAGMDSVITSLQEAIVLRDQRKPSRFGLKTGVAIGAAVTVAAIRVAAAVIH